MSVIITRTVTADTWADPIKQKIVRTGMDTAAARDASSRNLDVAPYPDPTERVLPGQPAVPGGNTVPQLTVIRTYPTREIP